MPVTLQRIPRRLKAFPDEALAHALHGAGADAQAHPAERRARRRGLAGEDLSAKCPCAASQRRILLLR